ncbi:hypothetical protein ES703_73260 [subsurface metagenome]
MALEYRDLGQECITDQKSLNSKTLRHILPARIPRTTGIIKFLMSLGLLILIFPLQTILSQIFIVFSICPCLVAVL